MLLHLFVKNILKTQATSVISYMKSYFFFL